MRRRKRSSATGVRWERWVAAGYRLWQEGLPMSVGGRFGAVGRPDLVEDVAHVAQHGVQADHQRGGDLLVALARRDQAQHLDLAFGQPGGVLWPWHDATPLPLGPRLLPPHAVAPA